MQGPGLPWSQRSLNASPGRSDVRCRRRRLPGNLAPVYLLPSFDEYTIGYRPQRRAQPMHAQKITPASNGVFVPIVVIDGHISGT